MIGSILSSDLRPAALSSPTMTKAISIATYGRTYEINIANISIQSEVIVSLILSDESCDVATQLGSTKLVEKFILGGFIQ